MTARIPARSQRQAMDWSLVLVSQGIETTIEHHPEDGWALIVPALESARALKALKQYHLENRRWQWQRAFLPPAFSFDWTSLAWVFLIGLFFWLEQKFPALRDAGSMNAVAVSRGEWWRMFTAVFLHADAAHLAANACIGLVLLGLTMGRYGAGIGVLAAYLTGVAGNAATWLFYSDHRSLGASGMVLGCIGLLAVQSVSELFHREPGAPASGPARSESDGPSDLNAPGRHLRPTSPSQGRPALRLNHPHALKYVVSGLAGGAMLFAFLGLSPESDVLAHLGGFISGILLGSVLVWIPHLAQKAALNIFAGALFCLLAILAWWRALV